MRENRLYGSEGGVAKAIPTPILFDADIPDHAVPQRSSRAVATYSDRFQGLYTPTARC
jgi:hypothetical protein